MMITVTSAETHYPLPHSAHTHCLFSRNMQQVLMGTIFSTWRDSTTHICFISASMSDDILSDYPSAAICHMAK